MYFSSYEFLKFLTFLDFNLIFNEFLMSNSYLKLRKGGFYSTDPVDADMARRTCTDATRHARPRGRACEVHAAVRWRGWHRHVAGGHADPRERPCGVPRGRGLAFGGPWLGVWGGNVNALLHPTSYIHNFHLFRLCGTMFQWIFYFAGDVDAR